MNNGNKPKQNELFEAETQWFHVFKDMIDSGDVAKIGAHATTIYLVIKAHANFSNGAAFPSMETINEKSGISLSQIKRELKKLEENGYISKEKAGRNNIYKLREKVQIFDTETGMQTAVASWEYLPTTVSHAVSELKNLLITGQFEGARFIHIERMQLQINNGNQNVQINEAQTQADIERIAAFNPEVAEVLARQVGRYKAVKEG